MTFAKTVDDDPLAMTEIPSSKDIRPDETIEMWLARLAEMRGR